MLQSMGRKESDMTEQLNRTEQHKKAGLKGVVNGMASGLFSYTDRPQLNPAKPPPERVTGTTGGWDLKWRGCYLLAIWPLSRHTRGSEDQGLMPTWHWVGMLAKIPPFYCLGGGKTLQLITLCSLLNKLPKSIYFAITCAYSTNTWPPDWKSQLTGKDLMLGKTEGRRRRGQQRMKSLGGLTNSMDISLSKFQEIVKNREAWHAAVHGDVKNQTQFSN